MTCENEMLAPAFVGPVERMVGPHSHKRMKQPYGNRWSVLHGEAYRIWLSSGDEPRPAPHFGMLALLELEDDADKAPAMAAEVWRAAEAFLKPQQVCVLRFRFEHDLTLDEIAQRMFVTRERIRQVEAAGLRELRRRLVGPNVAIKRLP